MSDIHDPIRELEAMRIVAETLRPLPPPAIERVLGWVRATVLPGTTTGPLLIGMPPSQPALAPQAPTSAASLPDFFARLNPSSGPERALVVGYWLQTQEAAESFEGKAINDHLKHLGYGLLNVTATLTLLMNQKPALVIQTRKAGTTRQARKQYRLTQEGMRRVRELEGVGT